jgi:hypothetical protein
MQKKREHSSILTDDERKRPYIGIISYNKYLTCYSETQKLSSLFNLYF